MPVPMRTKVETVIIMIGMAGAAAPQPCDAAGVARATQSADAALSARGSTKILAGGRCRLLRPVRRVASEGTPDRSVYS